jgi:phosphate transport system permease protein
MARRILIPTAITGLITATILGVARVVGEAAPAIIDAGGSPKVNYNPFKGQQDSLPLMIFTDIRSFVPNQHVRAWTAAFVLLAMILVLFVLARLSARAQNGLPLLSRRRLRKGRQ